MGAILAQITVYGFAIKNLTNKTAPNTNTKNENISKISNKIFLNFTLTLSENHIIQ